jgi:hypothetical protein
MARLKTILRDCDGRKPFEALIRARCSRSWVADYCLQPVRPRKPIQDSEERKLELRTVRALAQSLARTARLSRNPKARVRDVKGNLKKTQELIRRFHEKLGPEFPFLPGAPLDTALWQFLCSGTRESFADLGKEMEAAIPSLSQWLAPRPKFIFTARNDQQFKLHEHVRSRTGRWHHSEPARLLRAIYKADGITLERIPLQNSLRALAKLEAPLREIIAKLRGSGN